MRETARLLGFLLLVAFFAAGGFVIGRRNQPSKPEPQVIVRVDTCTVYDTVVRYRPVSRYSYIRDTVRAYFTTVRHDTVLAAVPIERKIYEEDSLYRAVVSGPRIGKAGPSLDSLLVFSKTTTITVTNTVPENIFVESRKRWSFRITAGPSVLATPSGQVHAGLGVTAGVSYRF